MGYGLGALDLGAGLRANVGIIYFVVSVSRCHPCTTLREDP